MSMVVYVEPVVALLFCSLVSFFSLNCQSAIEGQSTKVQKCFTDI